MGFLGDFFFFYIKKKHLAKEKIHSTEASHLGNEKKEEYAIVDNEYYIRLWVEQSRILYLSFSSCSKMDK